MKKEDSIYKLLEYLYFAEGLEDIRFLHYLNKKQLKRFCREKGEKICQIIYALLLEQNPEFILNKLKEEDGSNRYKNTKINEKRSKNGKSNQI